MLRPVLFLLLLCSPALPARSQSASRYRADLDALDAKLQQTPSFKDQVKGPTRAAYDALYRSLRADTARAGNAFDDFFRLARLSFPWYDHHLGFYQYPQPTLVPAQYHDREAVARYQQSDHFNQFPSIRLPLDSLYATLAAKPVDSVEGIYYYDTLLTVGLYRSSSPDELTGVVLKSTLPVWKAGQVAMRLYEYRPHCFRAIYTHPIYKYLMLYSNEKYRDHSLLNSWFYNSVTPAIYTKTPAAIDHTNISRGAPPFLFRALTPAVQYLRLGNFSATSTGMKLSQDFYGRIKDSLTARHLIVDLRNNTGGAEKVSRKFLQLLKRYGRQGKIYVLVNNGTMSQGEIFTLQLRKTVHASVYGQTTSGTIGYGVNYGDAWKLPSGRYAAVLTDMRNRWAYRKYESIGVAPDHPCDPARDWVQQLLTEIGSETPVAGQ